MKNKKENKTTRGSLLSWAWFLVAAGFAPFVMAQSSMVIAGWVTLLFFLRFSRTVPSKFSLPAIGLAIFAAVLISFSGGFVPGDPINLYTTAAGIAVAYAVLFAIDKMLWRRFGGLLSTLVFPFASTTIGFLATLGNAVGTAGSEAYSQSSAPIAQLAAFTGIWGIVFLIAWFASVFNAWWEQGFSLRKTRQVGIVFGAVVIIVTVASATQYWLVRPSESATVAMAGVAPTKEIHESSLVGDLSSDSGRKKSRASVQRLNDYLFDKTNQEAQKGAKIVVWSEDTAKVLKSDEPALLDRAQSTAKQHGIYLQIGLGTYDYKNGAMVAENRAIMITPKGEIAWDYHKAKLTPGDIGQPGPGIMPYIDTPYGRIATVICQDDLFPKLVAQAGKNDVDILLIPSSDWPAIAEWHPRVATYRSVENGASVFRPTRKGISLALDYKGRELARADGYDGNKEQILRANLPTQGVDTVYPVAGDFVAYGSMFGLLGLSGYAIAIRKKKQQ